MKLILKVNCHNWDVNVEDNGDKLWKQTSSFKHIEKHQYVNSEQN